MSGRNVTVKESIKAQHALYLKSQPTTLRRCLRCDDWMHSTGVDHRLCNSCKGEPNYIGSPVGKRLTLTGKRTGYDE